MKPRDAPAPCEPLAELLPRLDRLITAVERLAPASARPLEWERHRAFRWRRSGSGGYLEGIAKPHRIALGELLGIEAQKAELLRNTRQFLAGRPANNALLWGSRGTGKSSLVKALLTEFAPAGLRLIEVDKHDLTDLPDIMERIGPRPERFVLFCDDLSFEADDPRYKALKATLDGSVAALADNALIYATSNRRHLLPEYLQENLQTRNPGGEIHHGEAVEEKISLSERFGIWLSFHPFGQEQYLEIVRSWLRRLGAGGGDAAELREEALRWALARGSRSGRAAYQFALDRVGREGPGPG